MTFHLNLTFKCQSLSIVLDSAVESISPGMYRDLSFHFGLKIVVVVYQLITELVYSGPDKKLFTIFHIVNVRHLSPS